MPIPVPWKIRENVPETAIDALLDRTPLSLDLRKGCRYLYRFDNENDKFRTFARYALSYKEAFEKMRKTATEVHTDAKILDEGYKELQISMLALAKETAISLRLLGNVSQEIKVFYHKFKLYTYLFFSSRKCVIWRVMN